jgi:hypothetical protein
VRRHLGPPRKEFIYVSDDGQVVPRYDDWKAGVPGEARQGIGVWREPAVELRVLLLFNLLRNPFERAQHHSNTYNDRLLERTFVLVPLRCLAAKFLQTMKDYPPSQSPASCAIAHNRDQPQAGSRMSAGAHEQDRAQISKGSNAAHRAFSKLFSSKRSFLRLSSMCPSIMRPHGAKAANSAGRPFERSRTSSNSLINPAIHNNPVIKPELVEFA